MEENAYISVDGRHRRLWNEIAEHPLQSWEWGEFRLHTGVEVERLATRQKDTLTHCCQITFHRIPHTPWTIGYIPKGPPVTPALITATARVGKIHKSIFIQFEPNVPISAGHDVPAAKGLRRSHHPLFTRYTFRLDLTKSPEQLLHDMHPKTRYNIGVARRHGVRIIERSTDAAFSEYLRLQRETVLRQGFYAHDSAYHQAMWRYLRKANIAKLFLAEHENDVLAAWVLFLWKNELYYPYGASSSLKRHVMAPSLLLWESALWGKRHGMKAYDLWGALGPSPDKNDPFYGFHRFKQGFGPELTEFIGSFDLILNRPAYEMYRLADRIRWNLLTMKKH